MTSFDQYTTPRDTHDTSVSVSEVVLRMEWLHLKQKVQQPEKETWWLILTCYIFQLQVIPWWCQPRLLYNESLHRIDTKCCLKLNTRPECVCRLLTADTEVNYCCKSDLNIHHWPNRKYVRRSYVWAQTHQTDIKVLVLPHVSCELANKLHLNTPCRLQPTAS